jgi:membrane protein DedA with SNARE-associated domain
VETVADRYGPLFLVLARGVPVFAEASVLLMGLHRLSWRRFLPVVAASNLGIAWAYSALGTWAADREWLPMALGISVALPFLWTLLARQWMPHDNACSPQAATLHVQTTREGKT